MTPDLQAGPAPVCFSSPVVQLGSHCGQALARDAIGSAVLASDEAAPAQPLEDAQGAVAEPPAVAVEAVDFDDVALLVLVVFDAPALRERVQRALLVLRYVHLEMAC